MGCHQQVVFPEDSHTTWLLILRSTQRWASSGMFQGCNLKGRGRRYVKGSGHSHQEGQRGAWRSTGSLITGPRTGGSASPASWDSIFHHGITCYLNPPFLSPSFSSSFLPSFLFSLPPFLKRGAVILLPRRWKLILRIWPKKISYYNGVWLSKAQLCPKKSY